MYQLPMPGTGAFLLLAFAGLVVIVLLVLLQLTRLGFLVRERPWVAVRCLAQRLEAAPRHKVLAGARCSTT